MLFKKNKEQDCIDACIWIGAFFEENHSCAEYIKQIGYKLRPNGLITVPLLGEIITLLIIKVPPEKSYIVTRVFEDLYKIINKLKNEKRLEIARLTDINKEAIEDIKETDFAIDEDDALHLAWAIKHQCKNFITLDKKLIENEKLKSVLRNKYRLRIKSPD